MSCWNYLQNPVLCYWGLCLWNNFFLVFFIFFIFRVFFPPTNSCCGLLFYVFPCHPLSLKYLFKIWKNNWSILELQKLINRNMCWAFGGGFLCLFWGFGGGGFVFFVWLVWFCFPKNSIIKWSIESWLNFRFVNMKRSCGFCANLQCGFELLCFQACLLAESLMYRLEILWRLMFCGIFWRCTVKS